MGRLYEPSILQHDTSCWLCGNQNPWELERHECFYGSGNRGLSIQDKLTVLLCANTCHRNGTQAVHNNRGNDLELKKFAQREAMQHYGWSVPDFAERYGKSWLD